MWENVKGWFEMAITLNIFIHEETLSLSRAIADLSLTLGKLEKQKLACELLGIKFQDERLIPIYTEAIENWHKKIAELSHKESLLLGL